MKLNLFACDGGYLLAPECMQASVQARGMHHGITHARVIDVVELPDTLRQHVLQDIQRRDFAFVAGDDAGVFRH